MRSQRLLLAGLFAAVALGPGPGLAHARPGGGGHGGGGGHAFAGPGGFHRGYGPHGFYGHRGFYGYPWWYGYPGWYGLGLGVGFGYGWGYGYGYPYGPYWGDYPVYVLPGDAPRPADGAPVCPAGGPAPAIATAGAPSPIIPVRLTDSDVVLTVRVTPDAVVRINGEPTAQTGPRREFVSSGLAPGRTYTFAVSARWVGPDGQAVEREQRVHVQGGERRSLTFLVPPPPPRDLPAIPAGAH
jgi:uncharacterized protein (TIGR03000 family)